MVKVFLAVRQGIAEEVGKSFQFHHHANMGSCEASSDIKTYIEDVLAKRIDSGKLFVRNHGLINKIADALVKQANGMLVCHTASLLRVLTEAGFFGLLFKLKVYAARSVTVIFAKRSENSQKTYQRPITASCQESIK